MKVYCKRTFFRTNTNYFPVNGKEYGEDFVVWERGKWYDSKEPEDYEKKIGVYRLIISEHHSIGGFQLWDPINKKEFSKYFTDQPELRNEKIDQILKPITKSE